MKIKDAIDWVDVARMGYICDPNECGLEKGGDPCKAFHCDEIHDALVMAMDAFEYQYKYKWHDLKKNPNDLPSKEGLYLVAYVEDCGMDFQIDLGYYEEAFGYGYGWHNYFYGNIIAWKEIEPFLTT